MLGIYRVLVEAFVAGKFPCYYPYVHTALFIAMMLIRWFKFKSLKYHYFMLDFCYYVNILFCLFLFVWPTDPRLTGAIWGFA